MFPNGPIENNSSDITYTFVVEVPGSTSTIYSALSSNSIVTTIFKPLGPPFRWNLLESWRRRWILEGFSIGNMTIRKSFTVQPHSLQRISICKSINKMCMNQLGIVWRFIWDSFANKSLIIRQIYETLSISKTLKDKRDRSQLRLD